MSGNEAAASVYENRFDLFARDAREPIKKIVDSSAVLEVFKQRFHRYTSCFENPGSADLFRISLDRRTLAPIQHDQSNATRARRHSATRTSPPRPVRVARVRHGLVIHRQLDRKSRAFTRSTLYCDRSFMLFDDLSRYR